VVPAARLFPHELADTVLLSGTALPDAMLVQNRTLRFVGASRRSGSREAPRVTTALQQETVFSVTRTRRQ
jgi:hypothetical protein